MFSQRLVRVEPLVRGDSVVSAGVDVDEVEHVDEGLQQAGRVLQPGSARICTESNTKSFGRRHMKVRNIP